MTKTMILKSVFITYAALISLVSMSECDPLTEASITGFTTELIHRDSPQSPSYDPSLSPSQRIVNALKRSFNRVQRFNMGSSSQRSPDQSEIINGDFEYLMKYSVGTPPVPSLGIPDTAGGLTWTQCEPCIKCFNQTLPLFKPNTSSTYTKILCNTPECHSLEKTHCGRNKRNCLYSDSFGDYSFSHGELATDTFALASTGGETVSIPNITFGCGFKNAVEFEDGESGVVGLGVGEASLVRQLGPLAQGKFSYCLTPLSDHSNSSKLHFGSDAGVSGSGVVSTPFVEITPDNFYFLTLEAISVGNQRLEFSDPSSSEFGNTIIDSRTTLTFLPFGLYENLEKAINSSIKLKQIQDPEEELDLCYFTREDIQVPNITVHFKGADVELRHDNVFVRTSDVSLCLAAQPMEGLIIYGNIAQINFLVGYDLEKKTVSFKPTDCAK